MIQGNQKTFSIFGFADMDQNARRHILPRPHRESAERYRMKQLRKNTKDTCLRTFRRPYYVHAHNPIRSKLTTIRLHAPKKEFSKEIFVSVCIVPLSAFSIFFERFV